MSKSRSQLIANGLCERFSGLKPSHGGLCFRPGLRHFVQGFSVERGRIVDSYYVWAVLSPLWIGLPSIKLNYSKRLNNNLTLNGTPGEIIEKVSALVVSDVEALDLVCGPEVPIKRFVDSKLNTLDISHKQKVNECLDLGVANILIGQYNLGIKWLTAFLASLLPGYIDKHTEFARSLLLALDHDPNAAVQLISKRESDTATALRL